MGHVQNKQQNLIHSILFSSSRLWCILFLWIFYLFVFNSDTESRWIVQAGLKLTINSEFHFLSWHLTTIYHLPTPYQNLFETNNVLPTRKACTSSSTQHLNDGWLDIHTCQDHWTTSSSETMILQSIQSKTDDHPFNKIPLGSIEHREKRWRG